MAASTVPTVTILGTTRLADGSIRNRIKIALGANYAIATGVPLTAALCGLRQFLMQTNGQAMIDPVVTGVNQGGVLAEIVGQALFLGYPTGGAGTNPTTPAAPTVLASTGVATASAVDATRPTGAVLPGIGKAFPDQAVTTGLIVFADAFGYPN